MFCTSSACQHIRPLSLPLCTVDWRQLLFYANTYLSQGWESLIFFLDILEKKLKNSWLLWHWKWLKKTGVTLWKYPSCFRAFPTTFWSYGYLFSLLCIIVVRKNRLILIFLIDFSLLQIKLPLGFEVKPVLLIFWMQNKLMMLYFISATFSVSIK